jgi:hypothetical protein
MSYRPVQPLPPTDHRDAGQIHRDTERAWSDRLEEDRRDGLPYYFICKCIKCGKSHNIEELICKGCGANLKFIHPKGINHE